MTNIKFPKSWQVRHLPEFNIGNAMTVLREFRDEHGPHALCKAILAYNMSVSDLPRSTFYLYRWRNAPSPRNNLPNVIRGHRFTDSWSADRTPAPRVTLRGSRWGEIFNYDEEVEAQWRFGEKSVFTATINGRPPRIGVRFSHVEFPVKNVRDQNPRITMTFPGGPLTLEYNGEEQLVHIGPRWDSHLEYRPYLYKTPEGLILPLSGKFPTPQELTTGFNNAEHTDAMLEAGYSPVQKGVYV